MRTEQFRHQILNAVDQFLEKNETGEPKPADWEEILGVVADVISTKSGHKVAFLPLTKTR